MSQNRRWINTRVESVWDNEKQQLVVISREGYWYEGDMALAHNAPQLDQDSYAFYADGTESGSTIIGSANTPQTLDGDTTYLVRFLIQETNGGDSSNFIAQLEYDVNNSGTFNNVTSTSNNVRAVVSSSLGTDGSNTTQRLGAGTYLTTNGGVDNGDGAAGGASLDFTGNTEAEVVFAVQFRNADLTDQDTVQLRVAGMTTVTNTASATINVAAPAITGTLAATETGNDSSSASGTVAVSGSAAASEIGSDASAMSGQVAASGSMSVSETGADLASMSGTVTDPGVTGSLSVTETGSDTASMIGTLPIDGALAVAETGTDAASFSGELAISGALGGIETGLDNASASASVAISGTLGVTEAGIDSASISGAVDVSGAFATNESGADVAAMSGIVTDPGVLGTLAVTETGSDTASMSGTVSALPITGTLSANESGLDTASMSGAVTDPDLIGAMSANESGADTASMSGNVTDPGLAAAMSATESGVDTFSGNAGLVVTGSGAATETGQDALTGSIDVFVTITFAASETGSDTAIMFSAREAAQHTPRHQNQPEPSTLSLSLEPISHAALAKSKENLEITLTSSSKLLTNVQKTENYAIVNSGASNTVVIKNG